MTHDPLERATRLLRDATLDVGDVGALPPERDEAIERLAEAMRRTARARRRRRLFGALAVAAAAAVGLGAAHRLARSGEPALAEAGPDLARVHAASGLSVVLGDGRVERPAEGARLAEGAELRTSAGAEARLEFDGGTHLALRGGSRMRLVEQREKKRFALEEGSLFAQVHKLGPADRFVVATPDTEIEVRGTAFRVSLVAPDPGCGAGTPTRLEVVEGVVAVRHGGVETRVARGGSWPRCAPPTPAAAATALEPPRPAATHAAHAASSSHLAEQNDLFDRAMRDKREGRPADALATLDRLLAAYPDGPLAESAGVERMRLFAASGDPRAKDAARAYLRRFPRGFARAEAETLASSP